MQQVLALYYQEESTQAEIGSILGVTESRVCQILGDATVRIRGILERCE
jgi:RNA polymerase sigma factor for flagellar operon FliA